MAGSGNPFIPDHEIPIFQEEFQGGGVHTGTAPSAEARLWQAEDGTIALFMVNYVDKETEFSYTIHPRKYGLDAGQLTRSRKYRQREIKSWVRQQEKPFPERRLWDQIK